MTISRSPADFRPCPLLRRLAAMLYDSMALIAIWMAGGALAVAVSNGAVESGRISFQVFLLVLSFLYFWLCWRRGGQTLGMRAWRIQLDPGVEPFGAVRTLARMLGAIAAILPLGLGYLWSLGRPDRATWSDLASGSALVVAHSGKKSPSGDRPDPGSPSQ